MPAAALFASLTAVYGQALNNQVLSPGEVHAITVTRGQTAEETLTFYLRAGYHVNSNKPNDDYLIPLRLTWTGPLEAGEIVYPESGTEKSSFTEKPLSVYSGTFRIVTKFQAPASAASGTVTMTGKLRYQACNDHECLRPQTVSIQAPVEIR